MSSIPGRAPPPSTPAAQRLRLFLATMVALLSTSGMAACAGEPDDSQPAASGSTGATRSGTTEAMPLGGGELIVFERTAPGGEERDLYAVAPEGGEPRFLRGPADYPHWSPDGSTLAFLTCMNPPDCTTAVALLERATGDVSWFTFPDPTLFSPCVTWSPSGTELACAALSEGDPTRNGLYTIRVADGKGLTRITRNPGGEDFPLAYSPDGEHILFARDDPSRRGSATQALFITPVGGGRPHRITPWGLTDDWAGWSPDGRTIVFGTNGSLYRVSPQGDGLARIPLRTPDPSSARTAFDISFSPDGSRIVFSLGNPPGIYTARLDGSDVQRITTSPTEDHHAKWSAAPGS